MKHLKTIEGGYPLFTFKELLQWFKNILIQLKVMIINYNLILNDLILLKSQNLLFKIYLLFMMILVGGIIEFNLNLGFKFLKYLNQSDYFQDKFGYDQFDIFNISVN